MTTRCTIIETFTLKYTIWYLKWWLFLNRLGVRIKFIFHISRKKKKHNIKTLKSLCRIAHICLYGSIIYPFSNELIYYLWPGFLSWIWIYACRALYNLLSCNHKLQLDLILRCMATSDSETSLDCRHYSELETVWMLIQMLRRWLVGVFL